MVLWWCSISRQRVSGVFQGCPPPEDGPVVVPRVGPRLPLPLQGDRPTPTPRTPQRTLRTLRRILSQIQPARRQRAWGTHAHLLGTWQKVFQIHSEICHFRLKLAGFLAVAGLNLLPLISDLKKQVEGVGNYEPGDSQTWHVTHYQYLQFIHWAFPVR